MDPAVEIVTVNIKGGYFRMKKIKKTQKDQIKAGIKLASSLVVGYGVGEIVGFVLKDFQPSAKGIKKSAIKIGALALTGMAIKKTCDYVENEIDEAFDMCDEMVNGINVETEELEEENDG